MVTRRRELRPMNVHQIAAPTEPREAMHAGAPKLALIDESMVVSRAKSGCSYAFGELYERHRRTAYRTVYRILGNREDAEDTVQRSFQRAFIHLSRFRGDSRFSTWLTRIAINEALMLLRQRRTFTPLTDGDIESAQTAPLLCSSDEHPSPEQLVMRSELQRTVLHAISKLRGNLRSVVLLR